MQSVPTPATTTTPFAWDASHATAHWPVPTSKGDALVILVENKEPRSADGRPHIQHSRFKNMALTAMYPDGPPASLRAESLRVVIRERFTCGASPIQACVLMHGHDEYKADWSYEPSEAIAQAHGWTPGSFASANNLQELITAGAAG